MTWMLNDMGEEIYLDNVECRYTIEDQDGLIIGWIFEGSDAHKAAAAEDIVEVLEMACKEADHGMEDGDLYPDWYERARAVLTKARGDS